MADSAREGERSNRRRVFDHRAADDPVLDEVVSTGATPHRYIGPADDVDELAEIGPPCCAVEAIRADEELPNPRVISDRGNGQLRSRAQ